MFRQQSTETVTLTRTQLQAILEIITQIGGISRSESWNESSYNNMREKISFNDKNQSNNALPERSHWERSNEDLLTSNGWINEMERSCRNSSLLMPKDSVHNNQSMSPSSTSTSESSKAEEVRADSAMTNLSFNESNFRRYAKINDSEFDWNALHHKRIKALEYSRALAQQHEEKMKRKREEMIRRREEEERLDKRLEQERIEMKEELERERQLIEDKKNIAEKKREAVIAAIERTPIIKTRKFLVDTSNDSQPVAAIKPQTRSHDTSAQTDAFGAQFCDTGTQTDVQLLFQLFNDLNVISKQKSKSMSKLEEAVHTKNLNERSAPVMQRKNNFSSETHLEKRNEKVKRSVWVKRTPNLVVNKVKSESIKSENKSDIKPNEIEINIKPTIENKEIISKVEDRNPFRRSSLNISQSSENLSKLKNRGIKSSIEVKNNSKFLPEISGRPHSRKKWYSQERFDPNFLS